MYLLYDDNCFSLSEIRLPSREKHGPYKKETTQYFPVVNFLFLIYLPPERTMFISIKLFLILVEARSLEQVIFS